jgi:hypothetical protein
MSRRRHCRAAFFMGISPPAIKVDFARLIVAFPPPISLSGTPDYSGG